MLPFTILDQVREIETIAAGSAVREARRLRKVYGGKRWQKRKGFCNVELADGSVWWAEIHWYEAHGIGRKEAKLKRLLERK